MSNIKNHPGDLELRKFGLLSALIVSSLFGLFIPWVFSTDWPLWAWVSSIILVLWALFNPGSLILLYRPWMKFGMVMGWINSRIILLLIFYFIITPAGLLARLFRVRLIEESFDATSKSYNDIVSKRDIQHMEDPY